MKNNCDKNTDQIFNPKESILTKLGTRGNTQRRLLLKNGEVNISRYLMKFFTLLFLTRKKKKKKKEIGNYLKI